MKIIGKDVLENKFLNYGELCFYIIFISCFVILTSIPVITIGVSLTAAYSCFEGIEKNDGSITVKNLSYLYFRSFVKKVIPATSITIWFLAMGYSIFRFIKLIDGNIYALALLIFITIECVMFFQVIFFYLSKGDLTYIDTIIKSFSTANLKIDKMIILVLTMVLIILFVSFKAWVVILGVGFHVYINHNILSKVT
ncbi:YesL family protein [Clostridium sediminicola]|uniref:hypothetical protein n=1 Tax=Clostridium sediminicola TaxID=3114879 RepID=UPI0031F1E4E4